MEMVMDEHEERALNLMALDAMPKILQFLVRLAQILTLILILLLSYVLLRGW